MNRLTASALAGAVLAAAIAPMAFAQKAPAPAPTAKAATETCITPTYAGASPQGKVCISSTVPYAEDFSNAKTTKDKQLAVFNWAWNTFIAVSWPVSDQRGVPDNNKTLGDAGARVWESYKTTPETFPTPPAVPTSWETPSASEPPAGCPAAPAGWAASGWLRKLTKANKTDDPALSGVTQPMSGQFGHLIDQNGNYVYIDVMTNKVSYNFVLDNKFYDADYQAKATQDQLNFPSGNNATKTDAAINVKPSWKIIGANDNAAKFYSRPAYVINPTTQKCTLETVGLVGFHITAKTVTSPQWVWTTFEHKDNAPDCTYQTGNVAAGCTPKVVAGVKYNFFNPSCTTNCELNKLPTAATLTTPVQVARIIPIPDDIAAYNAQIQAMLKGTVWENYIMVDTQFPLSPQTIYGNPLPIALANTTLETYNQGTTPATQTSSCLGCHLSAPAAGTVPGKLFADFDWQMDKAQSYSKAAAGK